MDKEKELLMNKTYRQFIDAGLGLDNSVSLNDIVDDKLMGFGTTIDEKILNITELKELLARQKEQSKDIDLRWEIKPISHYTSADENTAFFADEIFLYANVGGESIEMYLRFSVVLSYVNDQWKIIHWHGSKPENVQSEEDTFGIENWKQKAEALEKLVEERTADLVVKNRELEIETSLEKVRAQALGMYKPDDLLNVCRILFKELSLLGFSDIRNAIIHTFNDEEKYLIDYDYSDLTGGVITNIPYGDHPVIKRFLKQIRRSDEAFAEITVKGKELNEWKKFRKDGGQPDDPRLDKISALYYYFHSVGTGDIGISTFSSINEEQLQLLKRFRNVFDLAYKRYTDITKAEAQAREAQIEAALERVRGRAMAMHKSEELLEAGALLYSELSKLGIEKLTSGYMLIDEDEKMGWNYGVNPTNGQIIPKPVGVPLTEKKEIRSIIEAWKKQEPIHVKHLDPKETIIHQSYMADHAVNFPISKEKLLSITPERLVIHTFNFKQGYLIIVRGEVLSAEQQEMVVRFAKVFEMTYRRFLDLQKAEAQAREAQIELALERVRARTMAMQKSDELRETVLVIYQQLKELDFGSQACNIIISNKDTGHEQYWVSGFTQEIFPESYHVPRLNHHYQEDQFTAWRNGVKYAVFEYTGKEKKSFDKIFFTQTDFRNIPEQAKQFMSGLESIKLSTAFTSYGSLQVLGPEPLSEEKATILKRFAKVFEQTYTRFLDLQKAEAQVRKALIETGLERVRSKTMAMHKSEEVTGIAVSLNEELLKLGFDGGSTIMIIDKESGDTEQWTGFSEDKNLKSCYVPYFKHPYHDALLDDWKREEKFLVYTLTGEEKKTIDEYYFATGYKDFPESDKKWMQEMGSVTFSHAFMKYGAIHWGPDHLTEEQLKILQRFSKVFEQSYTRFLDLQKAEEQAREAKIEAALERVRSRSMAMHKSDDLHEVIKVVVEQLSVLSVKFNVSNFAKIDPDGSWDLWLSTPEQAYPALIHVPYIDHPIFSRITEAGTKGNDFFTDVYSREEANIFFHHFFENTIAKSSPEERKQFVYNSNGFTRSIFLTKNIWFSVARYDIIAFTDEENAIFKRFANVFEQAYTRFLDLQKAEAQAREAEIELSLERVRAKTMAMQKPSEFVDVINEIGEQFVDLGFDIEWVNFGANGLDVSNGIDIWNFAVIPGSPPISARVFIPYFDHPLFIKAVEELDKYRRTGNDLFIMDLSKDDKDRWLDHLFTKTIFKDVPEEYRTVQYAKPGYTTSNIALKDTWFSIGKFDPRSFTDEQHSILRRFAKAFGQAYTRFLDLQKAEAQAREAQIEASLERVRSRAMAMQNSDELKELIGTVFTELTKLDLVLTRCLIMIYDPRSNDSTWWMANSEAPTEPIGLFVQYHEYPTYLAYVKAWQERNIKWQYILEGKAKKEWDDFLFAETELSHLPHFVIEGMKAPNRVYLNSSFNSFGNLTLATLEPLSDEHFDIMLRFAKVFDLTYTRFNDLKQAEAQAKEAKIEAALERVRARSMGMQKSDELAEVVAVLYKQFEELDFGLYQVLVSIYDKKKNQIEWWSRGLGEIELPQCNIIPVIDHPFSNDLFEKWENGVEYYPHILEGELKQSWEEYLFTQTDLKNFPQEVKDMMSGFDKVYLSDVFMKYGSLQAAGPAPLPDEKATILKRFVKVLDHAYTRMKDLQNAEAQTRETQIELALERVRARTMAMHKSEELAETAQVLFHQLSELGGIPDRIAIGVVDEEKGVVNFWTTDQQGSHLDHSFSARLNERTTIEKTHQAWKEQKRSLVVDLHGEELKEWIQFAREEMGIAVKSDQIKDRRVHNFAFFSHGWILVTSHEPQSAETIQILERFASVFNLTYRRFLDLEKAEAQAREAQIEAALERTRTQSMLMQRSHELEHASQVFHEQLQLLGIPSSFSYLWLLKVEEEQQTFWASWSEEKDGITQYQSREITYPLDKTNPYIAECLVQWKSDETHPHLSVVPPAAVKDYFETWEELFRDVKGMKPEAFPDGLCYADAYMKYGSYGLVLNRDLTEEEYNILRRFSVEFERTYTRFLDLQKAEAQAREAQIEAALEKVRSRSLAMHKSDELQEVVNTVFERLQELNIEMDSCNIAIFKEGTRDYDYWIASKTQKRSASFYMPYMDLSLTRDLIAARESEKDFSTTAYSFEEKNEWFDYAFKNTDFKFLSEERKQFILNAPAITVAIAFSKNTGVQINRYNSKLPTEGESEILKRFSKVFEQAYIRFLDLEKAEAQGREAQIEAALERVRSSSLAMHKSEELKDVVKVVFENFRSLGLQNIDSVNINIFHEGSRDFDLWLAAPGQDYTTNFRLPYLDHPIANDFFEAVKKRETIHKGIYDYELKNKYFEYMFEFSDNKHLPEERKELILKGRAYSVATGISKHSSIFIHNYNGATFSEETNGILVRFSKVFDQAYTRFLDLQKAEANAREAQIEAGLERVRARTMAMHSSEDVSIATATMFTELEKLGIENFRGGITNIIPNRTQHVWSVNNLEEGKVLKSVGTFNIDAHPFWQLMYKEWESKKDFIHYYLAGEDKQHYFEVLNAIQGYLPQNFPQYPDLHFQVYYFNEGAVWTNSLQPHSEEDKQVMKRFTSVFSLTYRRYQDLRKAEAQAKEATIEAALERVRGKAMAMHSSKDLASTIGIFYHELEGLDLTPRRCGIGLINKETKRAEISTMNASADGEGIELIGNLDLRTHPVLTSVYNNWLTKTEYHPVLRGNEIKEYYQIVRPQIDFPDYPNDTVQYGYFIFFDEGGVYAWTEKELSEEELKIYRRFTSVLSLTYKRYKDLKDAEASGQAAIKDAALDRIRADIASMRTINDLDRITPLIWNELTVLGVPFIRCGVFIMDEEEELIHTFLSTPDGKAIAAFHLSYDTPGNLNHVISNWKIKNKYIDHWDESEFKQFADILVGQGTLASAEQYLKTIPKGGFYLHFLPFLQGMLYVGNTIQLEKEEIELIQHVADAFSTAYARYEDFNKLEAAKQQVEKTLTDLKQAQTQLVQSEKMASLGEMTAGIAHEIQNPLNFVNNFSEVSKELLDEMKTELETGNTEDAKGIADDVIQNLEKINHHGKRADAIVKSMLQHSRSSSGKKEPTDINSLADEYLRLAYHGLRAKDKSFNAKFETVFDDSIGKINIISQDIGRVLVNLINNAFYAVSERKKQESNGYEPTVEVLTKKTDDKIEIKVKDNGNGIPQKVLDKIFQPFFTTKPTGQGTGLGLSLAYDIVTKGHGGELKVETREGEGSEFIIQLPVSKATES